MELNFWTRTLLAVSSIAIAGCMPDDDTASKVNMGASSESGTNHALVLSRDNGSSGMDRPQSQGGATNRNAKVRSYHASHTSHISHSSHSSSRW